MGARVTLSFAVEEPPRRWRMEEEDVPETPLHDAVIRLLMLILQRWAETSERSALVARNLGCRWDPEDARVGIDPDVALIEPAPPEADALTTLRVWREDHAPPRIAIEVVSHQNPRKDYLDAPLRCARLGVEELWVFDPTLAGPEDTGGPHRLQVWRQQANGEGPHMSRVYAGDGPARSNVLEAWLILTDDRRRLRIADDETGERWWPTGEEAERAAREQERAAREQERERASRLEAKLRSLGVDPDDVTS
ncbi:MAG: Uma2 family endonuclease [Myxococcota bacterium]